LIRIKAISEQLQLGILFLPDLQILNPELKGRSLEQKGTKVLLEHLLNTQEALLFYDDKGKPFLKDRPQYLSISHSHDYLVILLNKTENTGVDIERLRDKVLNIRHKFLSDEELLFCGDDLERHIRLWAAKEAVYKWYGKKELDFKTHLFVPPYTNPQSFEAQLRKDGTTLRFQMGSEIMEQYLIVYLLHEIC
jgi:4'-phosphopantetheinyl transferase